MFLIVTPQQDHRLEFLVTTLGKAIVIQIMVYIQFTL